VPQPNNPLELDAETMRVLGYQMVDRLVDRIAHLDEGPAWQGAPRSELEPKLREPAPETGRDFTATVERLYRDVLPYAARVDHPRFMAFVPGAPTWPGILADFLVAGHNIFQGTWLGGGGLSMLELVVIDWFKDWIGLPSEAGGLFLSGGSAANLTALATARTAYNHTAQSVIYVGAEAHSSVAKAIRVIGCQPDQVRIIPSDADLRMEVSAVRSALQRDRAAGRIPLAVVASAGTTSTGAIDPLAELADLAREAGAWFHVDAAYGGFSVLTARGKQLLRGIENADSITLDPHKWLYQPFETGCLLVRDARLLERTFSTRAAYLQDTELQGAEVNFGERGIQLTRTARALKVWLSIQCFGVAAFRDTIDRCLDLALFAEQYIRASPRLELLRAASLGIVCFRRAEAGATPERLDALNNDLVMRLGQSGLALISSTRVDGAYALRLCILNHRTGQEDVEKVLRWLETA
jgi:aromatic-L-amino-acid/L-tryptophan decarboxylase